MDKHLDLYCVEGTRNVGKMLDLCVMLQRKLVA